MSLGEMKMLKWMNNNTLRDRTKSIEMVLCMCDGGQ